MLYTSMIISLNDTMTTTTIDMDRLKDVRLYCMQADISMKAYVNVLIAKDQGWDRD